MMETTSWNTVSSYAAVLLVCICIGMSVVCNLLLGVDIAFWHSRPKSRPPGPRFKLPLGGNFYIYLGDTLKKFSEMRKR